MLSYAIKAALEAEIFDEIMVSTDDKEIATMAKKYGAKVPFMRSKKTSNDFATTKDVVKEVLDTYTSNNIYFNKFCCIYPCVPFLTGEILRKANEKFEGNENMDSLIPVVRFSFPIQRALKSNRNGFLSFRELQYAQTRTQDLEPMYHDAGMFYFAKTKRFYEENCLIMPKTGYIEFDEMFVQDIDNESDWNLAELKFAMIAKQKR